MRGVRSNVIKFYVHIRVNSPKKMKRVTLSVTKNDQRCQTSAENSAVNTKNLIQLLSANRKKIKIHQQPGSLPK